MNTGYNSGVHKMFRSYKLIILCAALFCLFGIKTKYHGQVSIRLTEPSSFGFSSSSYSNLIFYSLMYENFFYLKSDGNVYSNIFDIYRYEKDQKRLVLKLKDNLSFSDGSPILPRHIKKSLKTFLGLNLIRSKRAGKMIRDIRIESDRVIVELLFDQGDIVEILSAPELVLQSDSARTFSGIFTPLEWEKGKNILFHPNPYAPGGRTYLDSLKVDLYDYFYPDIFLAKPGMDNDQFDEYKSGIYQNIFLSFPQGGVGQNTRIALFTILKEFLSGTGRTELNSLTSDDESPISIKINRLGARKTRSILRYSKIKLYVLSSLNELEEQLQTFLETKKIPVEVVYLSDDELDHFLKDNSVKFLLLEKLFNRHMPIEEKIKKIIKEVSFTQFSEKYLQLMNQLDEIQKLNNEELIMDQLSNIILTIINDGFVLPLYQKRYSLYINKKISGIELDYYGRPLFQKIRKKSDTEISQQAGTP